MVFKCTVIEWDMNSELLILLALLYLSHPVNSKMIKNLNFRRKTKICILNKTKTKCIYFYFYYNYWCYTKGFRVLWIQRRMRLTLARQIRDLVLFRKCVLFPHLLIFITFSWLALRVKYYICSFEVSPLHPVHVFISATTFYSVVATQLNGHSQQ